MTQNDKDIISEIILTSISTTTDQESKVNQSNVANYYDTDDLSFLSLLKICCYGLFFMILSFVLTVLFICLLAYLIR